MKKDLPKDHPSYHVIADSSYILLPDLKVARLLTPMTRNDVTYYNLFVPGYTRMSLDDIAATVEAGKITKAEADLSE